MGWEPGVASLGCAFANETEPYLPVHSEERLEESAEWVVSLELPVVTALCWNVSSDSLETHMSVLSESTAHLTKAFIRRIYMESEGDVLRSALSTLPQITKRLEELARVVCTKAVPSELLREELRPYGVLGG